MLVDVVFPPAERGQNQGGGQQPNLVPIAFGQFWNGPQEAAAQLRQNGQNIHHRFGEPFQTIKIQSSNLKFTLKVL